MMEWLQQLNVQSPDTSLPSLIIRLLLALALGCVVAAIYRWSKPPRQETHAFSTTLVLLCVVIAMVTQVIGDSVARAFSLVGALSIVRFRTVVQDTRDTAFVIFAVVVGMAVGASNLQVAVSGIVVVALAAYLFRAPAMRPPARGTWETSDAELAIRMSAGHDPSVAVQPVLARTTARHELVAIETARRGVSMDCLFRIRLKPETQPAVLVQELNRLDGVQSVELTRRPRGKKRK